MTSNGQVDLVLVEDILKCRSEVICNPSDTGQAASTAGGGVNGPVEVGNDPGGDAPVHGCQVICDEPGQHSYAQLRIGLGQQRLIVFS